MKTLYLVRHAKSSWDSPNLTDFERPLNDRGRKAAPLMAKYIFDKGILPQRFVSSEAVRAISTARLFADKMQYAQKDIDQDSRIYNSTSPELLKVIQSLDDNYNSIALFGHDTSITVTTEELSNQRFLHFPTCGVAGIQLNVNSWADVKEGCGQLLFFYFPKGVQDELKALKKVKS